MARTTTIDDEDLIRAAREVFLERGIHATTADVAKRAGVSEGTLFHRFGSKAGLFRAAMRPPSAALLIESMGLSARSGQGEIFEQICEVVSLMIAFFEELMPLIMMGVTNSFEAGLPEDFLSPNPPPVALTRALASYFESEMRGGRLRRVDPEILTRTLTGAAWGYVFNEILAKHGGFALPLPERVFVRGVVDIVLRGASPPAPARSPQRRVRS